MSEYCIEDFCLSPPHVTRSGKKKKRCTECKRLRRRAYIYKTPETYFKSILCNTYNRCKKKSIEFQISVEEILAMWTGRCAITGVELRIPSAEAVICPRESHRTKLLSPSLDRIDSTRGYTVDNLRIVSTAFNLMRSSMTDKQLLFMCNEVIKAHRSGSFPI